MVAGLAPVAQKPRGAPRVVAVAMAASVDVVEKDRLTAEAPRLRMAVAVLAKAGADAVMVAVDPTGGTTEVQAVIHRLPDHAKTMFLSIRDGSP